MAMVTVGERKEEAAAAVDPTAPRRALGGGGGAITLQLSPFLITSYLSLMDGWMLNHDVSDNAICLQLVDYIPPIGSIKVFREC
jgi:hypothetical protein